MPRKTSIKSSLNEMVQLNEGVTGRNMNGVMKKWNKQMNAINEAFEGKVDDYKLLSTAILLENTSQHLNHIAQMRGLNEATQPSDVSFFKRYAIEFVA